MATSYATYEDVEVRLNRELSESEQQTCEALLEDAGLIIDAFNANAPTDNKKLVSCRMVIRAMGDGESIGVPVGATQGSMSGLGYSQSWTVSNGSVGELYLSKLDKELLGRGNAIGSYSPVQALAGGEADD
jgi:hypothetical protein